MEWFYPKRRGPEWKQAWTTQTLSSISAPPLPLVAVFSIVIFLLSISQYTTYKSQISNAGINFQLFLFLVPVLLIFFMRSSLVTDLRWLDFWAIPRVRRELVNRSGASPWGVAGLVVLLLVLVSYQSLFQSKWFAPLRRGD